MGYSVSFLVGWIFLHCQYKYTLDFSIDLGERHLKSLLVRPGHIVNWLLVIELIQVDCGGVHHA